MLAATATGREPSAASPLASTSTGPLAVLTVEAFTQVGVSVGGGVIVVVTGVATGVGVSKDFPVYSNLRKDAGDATVVGVGVRIAARLVCSSTIGVVL